MHPTAAGKKVLEAYPSAGPLLASMRATPDAFVADTTPLVSNELSSPWVVKRSTKAGGWWVVAEVSDDMLKLQADYVFPIHQPPIENGVVVVNSEGYIVELVSDGVYPPDEVTRYRGVLCPGFVNAHCHIELSHLKGVIAEGTGLIGFLQLIGALRQATDETTILQKIVAAEKEMMENGIVAVGDISNTTHSFDQKNKGNMNYHTFLEIFGLNPARAETSMELGSALFDSFPDVMGNRCSIAPQCAL